MKLGSLCFNKLRIPLQPILNIKGLKLEQNTVSCTNDLHVENSVQCSEILALNSPEKLLLERADRSLNRTSYDKDINIHFRNKIL